MKILSLKPLHNGLNPDIADALFEDVARFASYGFNKSHAAAYASISFQTASLKTHHPEAFYAASMNMSRDDAESLAVFAGEMKTRSIDLLKPDVNQSMDRFMPIDRPEGIAISYALPAIRGVGETCALDIIKNRAEFGAFISLEDFRTRMGNKANKKAVTSLIHAGAFDTLIATRADAAALASGQQQDTTQQMSFFETSGMDTRKTLPEYDLETLLSHEFNALGYWHSTHPLMAYVPQIKKAGLMSLRALKKKSPMPRTAWLVAGVLSTDMRGTKTGGMMTILKLSDSLDVFETVAFDEVWAKIRHVAKKEALIALQVTVMEDEGDELRLMIQDAIPLEQKLQKKAA